MTSPGDADSAAGFAFVGGVTFLYGSVFAVARASRDACEPVENLVACTAVIPRPVSLGGTDEPTLSRFCFALFISVIQVGCVDCGVAGFVGDPGRDIALSSQLDFWELHFLDGLKGGEKVP